MSSKAIENTSITTQGVTHLRKQHPEFSDVGYARTLSGVHHVTNGPGNSTESHTDGFERGFVHIHQSANKSLSQVKQRVLKLHSTGERFQNQNA